MNVAEFLYRNEGPIFDVRSPCEFGHGHIPGSISLPLFSDEERHLVGCCYKEKGKQAAVLLGLSFVGPKLAHFAEVLSKHPALRLLCFRGGMRSSSIEWLAKTVGCTVIRLEGGYKSYRTWVLEQFEKQISPIVLSGPTGSGKTELLYLLQEHGYPTLDLEGLACHRGSVFGGFLEKPQPTQEQFENNLADALFQLASQPYFFAEAESRTIGRLVLPQKIYDAIHTAPLLAIECPFEERVERIVKDYGSKPKEELLSCITKLEKRLGSESMKEAMSFVSQGNLEEATRLLLHYYDKTYSHCLTKHSGRHLATNRDNIRQEIISHSLILPQ